MTETPSTEGAATRPARKQKFLEEQNIARVPIPAGI